MPRYGSMSSKAPFILLVNPWITDFAAFDLWGKPMGLLLLGALLREGGCRVELLDCLDRHDGPTAARQDVFPGSDRMYGTGKYPRMVIPKPAAYAGIPRRYHRYGIHPESFRAKLQAMPRPDIIWVTSVMTYWYPGLQETITLLKEIHPEVPVWLGGIYAGLCRKHARERSGADEIVVLPPERLPERIEAATGFMLENCRHWGSFRHWPPPALDLLASLPYAPLLTSTGCPFRCPYCASHLLQPRWEKRSAAFIYEEVLRCHERYGTLDFALFDDALLLQAESTLKPALERLCREGVKVRFHTPNALHIRALTSEWCELLHASGFTTIRLGLETTHPDRQRQWGGKVETAMFQDAVSRLRSAGFSRDQIGVYLLGGLPGQSPAEVAEAIRIVREAGAQPHLAEYSPLPGTSMWEEAMSASPYDVENEPLYHNNTFFACRRPDFTYEDLLHLKDLSKQARRPPPAPS